MSAVLEALPPFLTQAEIDAMCAPLKQPAAQIRYMTETLGLTVERKPGGQPLVWRSNVEAVKGPAMAGKSKATATNNDTSPNPGNLVSFLSKRGKHGTQTNRR